MSFNPQPVAIPPGSGRQFKFMGVTHKLTQPQTGGAFYLFEAEFEPETGNSLHVHRHEDEFVYVLQGGIEIRLDNRKLQVGAGGRGPSAEEYSACALQSIEDAIEDPGNGHPRRHGKFLR